MLPDGNPVRLRAVSIGDGLLVMLTPKNASTTLQKLAGDRAWLVKCIGKFAHLISASLLLSVSIVSHAQPLAKLRQQYEALNPLVVQIDFAQMIQQWSTRVSGKQFDALIALDEQLQGYQLPEDSSVCSKLELSSLQAELSTQLLAHQLMLRQSDTFDFNGSIAKLAERRQWYELLTRMWIGEVSRGTVLTPEQLFQMGSKNFSQAIAELRAIDRSQTKHDAKKLTTDDEILQGYYAKERIVAKNLAQWFGASKPIEPLSIARSTMGPEFLAPAYYDAALGRFYFHNLDKYYHSAQMDFLYLHEGLPGHHLQAQWAEKYGYCENLARPSTMVFAEGWAAYIERYGEELGLYQDPESLYYALKWRSLRAMRTMVDVGIHVYGWSDEKVRSFWLARFPEGEDMLEAALIRIKRWPMQVNTYVVGQQRILERLHHEKSVDPNFSIAEFHQNILSMSRLPISALEHYHTFKRQVKNTHSSSDARHTKL